MPCRQPASPPATTQPSSSSASSSFVLLDPDWRQLGADATLIAVIPASGPILASDHRTHRARNPSNRLRMCASWYVRIVWQRSPSPLDFIPIRIIDLAGRMAHIYGH